MTPRLNRAVQHGHPLMLFAATAGATALLMLLVIGVLAVFVLP